MFSSRLFCAFLERHTLSFDKVDCQVCDGRPYGAFGFSVALCWKRLDHEAWTCLNHWRMSPDWCFHWKSLMHTKTINLVDHIFEKDSHEHSRIWCRYSLINTKSTSKPFNRKDDRQVIGTVITPMHVWGCDLRVHWTCKGQLNYWIGRVCCFVRNTCQSCSLEWMLPDMFATTWYCGEVWRHSDWVIPSS